MDPLLYFSITSRAQFFPGAIRPLRSTLHLTCSTCQLAERGLRLLLEIEKIVAVICRRSTGTYDCLCRMRTTQLLASLDLSRNNSLAK